MERKPTFDWMEMMGLLHGMLHNRLMFRLQLKLAPLAARLARSLPFHLAIEVKGALNPVGRLEYPGEPLYLHIDSRAQLSRLYESSKEPETIRWLEARLRPGDVFYDIGANVGAFSFIAHRIGKGQIKILAFEPSFSTYAQLCRNIVLNRCSEPMVAYPLALSDRSSQTFFHYRSLESGAALHSLGSSSFTPVLSQAVLSLSIDDLVSRFAAPRPNLIKLDVDGTEYDILRGAGDTLNHAEVRSIQVEMDDRGSQGALLEEYLKAKGFACTARAPHPQSHVMNCVFDRTHDAPR